MWKEFGDAEAGDARFDGIEFAADFDGGIGFGVDGIEVWRAAIEVDIDDGFLGVLEVGGGFSAEDVGERESGDTERADVEGGSAGSVRGGGSALEGMLWHVAIPKSRWGVAWERELGILPGKVVGAQGIPLKSG